MIFREQVNATTMPLSANASWRQVLEDWRQGGALSDALGAQLASAPYAAFFWECPPLTLGTLSEPFECVLVQSKRLAQVTANPAPFFGKFRQGEAVAVFDNLGKNARLVAPCPGHPEANYTHLAVFERSAPPEQRRALWRAVGEEATARVSTRPMWISTSGLGVYWLHIRIEGRPKYYTHTPYRKARARRGG